MGVLKLYLLPRVFWAKNYLYIIFQLFYPGILKINFLFNSLDSILKINSSLRFCSRKFHFIFRIKCISSSKGRSSFRPYNSYPCWHIELTAPVCFRTSLTIYVFQIVYEKLTVSTQYSLFNFLKPYFIFFNWSVVDLQCCVNFCCTANRLSYTRIYILFYMLFHCGLSQDIEYSSLCYTVGPCCLSLLYIVVCLG